MSDADSDGPETHVLAIASHVTSGYVGNTMATICLQALGCEVSAIHTVNYSNHVGYGRFTGRKSTPEEVAELYRGLKAAGLNGCDVLLSGYCPSAALIEQVGAIARERKQQGESRPGSFFWVLDPVMGDNGRLYVAEETVPVYRDLIRDADLILPNQFEAELLSEVRIRDVASLTTAITRLHQDKGVPHVIITSIRLPPTRVGTPIPGQEGTTVSAKLSIIGSTARSDKTPRLFRITVPALPVFFSGTGDMFAALLVARLRQTAKEADLLDKSSWLSADDVSVPELPLAKAAEKVLASMHAVLKRTAKHYADVVRKLDEDNMSIPNAELSEDSKREPNARRHLKITRAAEVRVVQNLEFLRNPPDLDHFRAHTLPIDTD